MSAGGLKAGLQRRARSYLASGVITVPGDVYFLDALIVSGGGGGGGGGASGGSSAGCGGGGGSGWPVRTRIPVTPGSNLPVMVGLGGAGGAVSAAGDNPTAAGTGGDGGTSGVGSHLVPGGGGGGGGSYMPAGSTGSGNPGNGHGSWVANAGGVASSGQGGGGAGYCGGAYGNFPYPRVIGGRRQYSGNNGDGGTNGLGAASAAVAWADGQGTAPLLIPERFLTICWGGISGALGAGAVAETVPGSGGTGGYLNRAGAAGAPGFVLIEWESAL